MTPQVVEQVQTGERRARMTFEEYLQLPAEVGKAEWINGEVILFMPATLSHQQLVGFLDRLLGLYVQLQGLGIVLAARFTMRATPDAPAREPDLMFVTYGNRASLPEKLLQGPADLVEIVSDESVTCDRVDKFYEYEQGGIREYLIVDPRKGKQRIDWYALTPRGKYQAIVPDGEGRYHSVVVPGFWLRAEWLFQEELPNPLACLMEIAPEAVRQAMGSAGAEG